MRGDQVRRAAALTCWCGLLAATVVGLPALAAGPLEHPPVDPAGWAPWLAARTPVEAAFALGVVGVLATAWYLLAATVLGAALRLARLPGLLARIDVVTLPPLRRLLDATVGVGIAGVVLAGPVTATPEAGWARAAAVSEEAGLPVDSPANLPTSDELGHSLPRGVEPRLLHPGEESVRAGAATWTVAAGEHFWGIAARLLADAWGRQPSDREVVPYWQELIEVNRAELPDPANPDLLYPGQVLRLPPR